MNGRVYVQNSAEKKAGWLSSDGFSLPKSVEGCVLTDDVEKSLVFDVDNVNAFCLLNSFIEKGCCVVVSDSRIIRSEREPSASPFTTVY